MVSAKRLMQFTAQKARVNWSRELLTGMSLGNTCPLTLIEPSKRMHNAWYNASGK